MTQLSGFWTTGGATGHQVTSYTQSQLATAYRILAACSGFEGVAPGYLNKLAGSVPSVNTVQIDMGGAVVDGHWFINDASASVTIPSASGAGNTRIDRVVLRCTWSGYKAEITRIAGTDASDPVPPTITQSSGSTYDIKLYQALVDTSGNVTLTDERDWSGGVVDDATLEVSAGSYRIKDSGISGSKIADDAVTNAKLADPYDVAIVKVVDPTATLTASDGLITLPAPDVWNGKSVVRLWARLTGQVSSSGDVTVRIYNETDSLTIGTVTISAGNRIGSTTSISNPSLATDDIIRVDVTGAGTDAKGLDVQIKVDKS